MGFKGFAYPELSVIALVVQHPKKKATQEQNNA
jgi:hypothetical protein